MNSNTGSETNNFPGFKSAPLTGSNVPRLRKQTLPNQHKFSTLGFSQFSTIYRNNVIVDDMSKLKIDGDNSYYDNVVENNAVDELPMDISKLKIQDSVNTSESISNAHGDVANAMEKMNLGESVSVSEKMAEFAFTSKLEDIGTPYVEFKMPDMKSNVFSGLGRFEPKKDTRVKKKKGKVKSTNVGQSRVREDFGFSGRSFYENMDTFEAYSRMDISPSDNYSRETSVTSEEGSQINGQNNVSNVTTDDEVVEPIVNEVSETESFKSGNENLEYSSDSFVTAVECDESSTATSRRPESMFSFASGSENVSKGNFTFAASSSSQPSYKKKLPPKIVRDPYSSTADAKNAYASILFPGTGQKDHLKPVNEPNFRHEMVNTSSSSKIAEEACEKWRLRGNQAYGNGDLAKADDCYTQGLNSVSQNEKSKSCLRALMLCYSNRAATRISLGRMKEALGDCLMAANIDPDFLKVQVRAGHCYLAMGEVENAKKQYMKCLQSGTNNSVDRKVITEASEGLEKAEKVSDCIKECTDLFHRRTSEDLECALRVINETMHISTCSNKLLQMKADALFMLRRYEQVIQVCEQSFTSDEADTPTSSSSTLWKSHLIIRSYFYLGRLDDALEVIKKQENSGHITERVGDTSRESVIPLADTIRELLSHKTAGNEAYKSGKHAEAVEQYTAALSCNVESRPFASVCFCNRAAAYSGLCQIADAIADCSLAIALDPNYLKAISRRVSLYEKIRDYGQAAKDLQRLVSLLTTQEEKGILSGATDKLSQINELKQTRLQLSNVEEESRKGTPLNMYLILGVESTASSSDIKKAYRKAALRHHPDKAAQSLSRNDDGDDGLWKEIAENVHKDADRLFKMIGEAYAVLSNASKRSQYDHEEEMRNEAKRFTRSNSSRMATDVQNPIFERSGSRHQWPDSWKPYTESNSSSFRYSRNY